MHKPTAAIAVIAAAVALPIAATTGLTAAIAATTPTSTSTTPTSPYAPQTTPTPSPTPTPTPKPAATTAPAPAPTVAPPTPAVALAAFQSSIDADLSGLSYTKLLAGTAQITVNTPGAGTYVVSLSFRKPGQKYRSIAKAAVSLPKVGTTTTLPLKPNTYAPSTKKFIKKKDKSVRVQVFVSYELSNRTVSSTYTTSIKK